jgi:photosystem II stability/assembly factor-like uncharacterized protein
MSKIVRAVLAALTSSLFICAQANAQWEVVKRLAPKPTKTLNVDVPPTNEMRPPVVWSLSFADDFKGWAVCDDGTLLQTTGGGAEWTSRTIQPRVNDAPVMFVNPIHTFFNNERRGWVVAEYERASAILGTEDGGRSWKINYRCAFERCGLGSIWFADEKRGWVVGRAEGKEAHGAVILATRDGGEHWSPQYAGSDRESSLWDVRFFDASSGWAAGDPIILHTADGGTTWRKQDTPDGEYFFGVDAVGPAEAWVVGSGGTILHTADGGAHWRASKLPPGFEDHWLNSVKFVGRARGWVAGNDGAIFATTDGGKSWRLESKGESSYIRGLTATGNYIFAYGNDGVILRRPLR